MNNKIYIGDNLDIMRGLNSGVVDLIYLDPPFNSKRMYSAPIGSLAEKKATPKKGGAKFSDIWKWDEDIDIRLDSLLDTHSNLFAYIEAVGMIQGNSMKAYLTFMSQRIVEMHRVLKGTGSLYLHCDPTASHYLKGILDSVFGKGSFRNEIIWHYQNGGGRAKKWFNRKHDVLLWYSKSNKDWVYNIEDIRVPYKESSAYSKYGTTHHNTGKSYMPNGVGKNPDDVWILGILNISAKERTGYPTQKPLALLDRIIKASSNEGDLVFDPFCGCATTCVAADTLHRKWIGIDVSEVAADLVYDRLTCDENDTGGVQIKLVKPNFDKSDIAPIRSDLEKLTWAKGQIRAHFYGIQSGNCNGCGHHFPNTGVLHIDHIYPESKGGAWHLDNLQLLCGSCNSIKGNHPMEYLQIKIKARKAQMLQRDLA